jgi:hypothetical protein
MKESILVRFEKLCFLQTLILDVKRIPKGKDFAETIAGEIVVSRRVAELFE